MGEVGAGDCVSATPFARAKPRPSPLDPANPRQAWSDAGSSPLGRGECEPGLPGEHGVWSAGVSLGSGDDPASSGPAEPHGSRNPLLCSLSLTFPPMSLTAT